MATYDSELDLPRPVVIFAGIGIVALTGAMMTGGLVAFGWIKHMPDRLPEILAAAQAETTSGWTLVTDRVRRARSGRQQPQHALESGEPDQGDSHGPEPPSSAGS